MTIPVNRKRSPIVMYVGLFVSATVLYFLVKLFKQFDNQTNDNSIYIGLLGGLSISVLSLTVFAFLDYTKTMFDKTASLTISDKGLNDNLSIFSVGNISWTEITDIKIKTALKTNFLVIDVTNPKALIDRKSIFKRRTLKGFQKKFGSPVVISQKRIDYNIADLKDLVLKTKPI